MEKVVSEIKKKKRLFCTVGGSEKRTRAYPANILIPIQNGSNDSFSQIRNFWRLQEKEKGRGTAHTRQSKRFPSSGWY
jgi:hypothetical protein